MRDVGCPEDFELLNLSDYIKNAAGASVAMLYFIKQAAKDECFTSANC